MVLESRIPYQMKYVIVKLCLINLFQPIDQISYNTLFFRILLNARIVLIIVVSMYSIF